MSQSASLLTLLQLCDSAFPIGAYSQSWGFETFVQQGLLKDADAVRRTLTELLWASIAPMEGRACAVAWRISSAGIYAAPTLSASMPPAPPAADQFHRLNQTLTAMRWASETHTASLQMGDRLRRVVEASGILRAAQAPPLHNASPTGDVHHCAMFGWLCGALSIDIETACSAYLHTTCAAIISACVRLVPLGHTDGQRLITAMRAEIAQALPVCLSGSIEELSGFAPLYEAACVEHESLYSRLFQS